MIRLARIGKKKYPTYKFIVSDKRKDTHGTYLEELGHYNPNTKPSTLEIKQDRLAHWISVGAGMSNTVHNLLVDKGLVKGKKRDMLHKDEKPEVEEGATAPSAPATPVAPVEAKIETPKEEPKKEEPKKQEAPTAPTA